MFSAMTSFSYTGPCLSKCAFRLKSQFVQIVPVVTKLEEIFVFSHRLSSGSGKTLIMSSSKKPCSVCKELKIDPFKPWTKCWDCRKESLIECTGCGVKKVDNTKSWTKCWDCRKESLIKCTGCGVKKVDNTKSWTVCWDCRTASFIPCDECGLKKIAADKPWKTCWDCSLARRNMNED
jgi:hypothetical protein